MNIASMVVKWLMASGNQTKKDLDLARFLTISELSMTDCKLCWWYGKPIECPAKFDIDTHECANFEPKEVTTSDNRPQQKMVARSF